MSQQYTSASRVCATCDYWAGERELKQYGDFIEIDSPMDTASCFCRSSGWFGSSPVQACSNCASWIKWPALR